MEIDVIYKYCAPRAALKTANTIATATLELEAPVDVLNAAYPVGETVELQRDAPKRKTKPRKSTWSSTVSPCSLR